MINLIFVIAFCFVHFVTVLIPISAFDVAVIGAGVGGLVTSTRLAQNGHNVYLIEKNSHPGGRMSSEIVKLPTGNNYRFDIGPSLLLLPEIYTRTFQMLGKDFDEDVKILPVTPYYRCFFEEDCTVLDIDANNTHSGLQSIEISGAASFRYYMSIANSFLSFGLPTVIEEEFYSEGLIPFLVACILAFPLFSHSSMLSNIFKTDKARAMMSFQDLYVGLSPYKAPAVFSLLQALEFSKGIFYPQGGFASIAESLAETAVAAGVTLRTSSTVTALQLDESGRKVSAVVLDDGTTINTDYVVTNIDAPHSEGTLVPPQLRESRTLEAEPSCGVVSISWALDKRMHTLTHHSIFLSKHYKDSWACIDNPDKCQFNPDAFNFYVHAPSRTDSTVCPPDHDAITVLVPVPPLPKNKFADGNIHNLIDVEGIKMAVLNRMHSAGCIDDIAEFERHVLYEKVRSPTTWQSEFGLFRGSAFGLTHSLTQLSLLRPRFSHPYVRNLYRVGASTRPGNGVPLVMVGARLVTDCLLAAMDEDASGKRN